MYARKIGGLPRPRITGCRSTGTWSAQGGAVAAEAGGRTPEAALLRFPPVAAIAKRTCKPRPGKPRTGRRRGGATTAPSTRGLDGEEEAEETEDAAVRLGRGGAGVDASGGRAEQRCGLDREAQGRSDGRQRRRRRRSRAARGSGTRTPRVGSACPGEIDGNGERPPRGVGFQMAGNLARATIPRGEPVPGKGPGFRAHKAGHSLTYSNK
jgi:hypothetical protein